MRRKIKAMDVVGAIEIDGHFRMQKSENYTQTLEEKIAEIYRLKNN